MAHIPPAVIKVQGPHEAEQPDHKTHLQTQLQAISPTTTHLLIDEDTPSDDEWAILGAHLSKVEELELESGFNEELNDKHLPHHWPLKKLTLSSACGDLCQSPFIRKGLVQHLCLYFTCNLRFEGPTNDELTRPVSEAHRKEREEGKNDGIQITYLPELVVQHMAEAYADPNRKLDPENEPPADGSNLQTLEIFENDAIDTFCRFYGALPHLVENLHTLRLRSTSGLDFSMILEDTFTQIFPTLANLKVLNLTIGDVFQDPLVLRNIYNCLPPNLTTLYFRGPASLVTSEQWPSWLRAFESPEYLPHLQQVGFVLDLHYAEQEGKQWGKKESQAPADELDRARQECETLYQILRQRGIDVVSLPVERESQLLRAVDPRW